MEDKYLALEDDTTLPDAEHIVQVVAREGVLTGMER